MPLSMKAAVGGGSGYQGFILSGLQVGNPLITSSSADFGDSLFVSGLNIASGLTQVCSVDVPSGKKMILLEVVLSNLSSTSGLFSAQIEIDGEVKLSPSRSSSIEIQLLLVGGLINSTTIRELGVKSNLKIRATKPLSTSSDVSIKYILVEA